MERLTTGVFSLNNCEHIYRPDENRNARIPTLTRLALLLAVIEHWKRTNRIAWLHFSIKPSSDTKTGCSAEALFMQRRR
jgi:hypothetical protein